MIFIDPKWLQLAVDVTVPLDSWLLGLGTTNQSGQQTDRSTAGHLLQFHFHVERTKLFLVGLILTRSQGSGVPCSSFTKVERQAHFCLRWILPKAWSPSSSIQADGRHLYGERKNEKRVSIAPKIPVSLEPAPFGIPSSARLGSKRLQFVARPTACLLPETGGPSRGSPLFHWPDLSFPQAVEDRGPVAQPYP